MTFPQHPRSQQIWPLTKGLNSILAPRSSLLGVAHVLALPLKAELSGLPGFPVKPRHSIIVCRDLRIRCLPSGIVPFVSALGRDVIDI